MTRTKGPEEILLEQVIDLARIRGWRTAHFRPAKTERGWRTAVQGDGAGFPDLLLLRRDCVLAVELKGPDGRVSPAQLGWLTAFTDAGIATAIWRPAQWSEIERVLA